MGKPQYIATPNGPFVLFSMGLDGYEGECDLWNLPSPDEEVTVYHIIVRIRHEMDLLKRRTGEDFYLFGTHKAFVGPRKKIIENYGKRPIDILFTVNRKDEDRLKNVREPDPENVTCSSKRWRKMVNRETGHSEAIPEEINLWGWPGVSAYYGLCLAKFRYFRPNEQRYLSGRHLCHYLQESPVKSWFRFTMGTLYVDPNSNRKAIQDRRILATAKLRYPYVYEVRRK
jgi:hypothetical protein